MTTPNFTGGPTPVGVVPNPPAGILPTPTGNPDPTSAFTGYTTDPDPGLAAGWETSPTTLASMSEAVYQVQKADGLTEAEAFQTWYTAAFAKDPSITPDQAVGVWATGADLSTSIGSGATLLGQVPGAVAGAALDNPLVKAVSETIGAGESIEHFFDAIKGFFDLLTDKDMWISLAWLVGGAVLLALGTTMFVRSRGAQANG
jgi:hypothetical protein